MAAGLSRSCPVCFSPAGKKCTMPTDTGRKAVQWIHLKREQEDMFEPQPEVHHAGAIYGIAHPGPRFGCSHCMATVVQAENTGIELIVKPQ